MLKMGTSQIDIRFEGDNFYPSLFKKETKWPIQILVEKGEISPRGKYKGKSSPYGIALLKIDLEIGEKKPVDILDDYLNKLIQYKTILNKSGVEEIVFDIETSNSREYAFSLESDMMKKMVSLNARLDFRGEEKEAGLDDILERITPFLSSKAGLLTAREKEKLNNIKNNIARSSLSIHALNASHIYGFLLIYVLINMKKSKEKMLPFETEYRKYISLL
jgi:hypothetical protein